MITMQVIEYDGHRIPVGKLFQDNRPSNVRTLRVDGPVSDEQVQLTVIRQEHQGQVSEPMRVTVMTVARLVSKAFVPVDSELSAQDRRLEWEDWTRQLPGPAPTEQGW